MIPSKLPLIVLVMDLFHFFLEQVCNAILCFQSQRRVDRTRSPSDVPGNNDILTTVRVVLVPEGLVTHFSRKILHRTFPPPSFLLPSFPDSICSLNLDISMKRDDSVHANIRLQRNSSGGFLYPELGIRLVKVGPHDSVTNLRSSGNIWLDAIVKFILSRCLVATI